MVRLMFECPSTGKPLSGVAIEEWVGEVPDALIAMHCPKCSSLHEFTRSQGILMVGGRVDRPRDAAAAA
jgi:hypothetical protein